MYFITRNDNEVLCYDKQDEMFWSRYNNINHVVFTQNIMYFDDINLAQLIIKTYLFAMQNNNTELKQEDTYLKICKVKVFNVEAHSNI